MSWYDYIPPVAVGKYVAGKVSDQGHTDEANKAQMDAARANLSQSGNLASDFADKSQAGYGALGQEASQNRDYLRQLASGQHSVSAEQLRQGLQQNLAAQQSMAASARPGDAAMAARTAAIQGGRLGYGMAGQQALAGLQERNQAQQNLSGAILGARGQDLQATLGSRGQAIGAYGGVLTGPQDQGWWDKYGGQVLQAGQAAGSAYAASDERLKTDVEDGDKAARKAIDGLRAFAYRYKDDKHGKGAQFGVMAQAMEAAGLGHAVVDTPGGKMVHGAKAATSSLALVAALGKRVAKLEGAKK